MSLPRHLHLFLPSSSNGVKLESRIYFSPSVNLDESESESGLEFSKSVRSEPIDLEYEEVARKLGVGFDASTKGGDSGNGTEGKAMVERVIVASHPWSRLGGNMLDPVLTDILLGCVVDGETPTVLITFNARGVGRSGGWQALLSSSNAAEDFSAVEQWSLDVFNPKDIRRVGYSWGCASALTAPHPNYEVSQYLLISPPVSVFRWTSLFSSSFASQITQALSPSPASQSELSDTNPNKNDDPTREPPRRKPKLWLVYGTTDEFTSVEAYRALVEECKESGLEGKECDRAGHFWRGEDGSQLEGVITDWLRSG